mmetsp:Transcript_69444/g.208444  ORF Transcript_69444/g.208444 Transcript_69444/m.208444 type:complete len:98 (+) Transcript_69444:3-296(+)
MLADGAVVFDVRAPPATRCAMLRDLGWPEGTQPTAADLVAHILDRLEYQCAYDLAHEEGAVGRALGGDASDTYGIGGWRRLGGGAAVVLLAPGRGWQ